jgi:hypothetical protein
MSFTSSIDTLLGDVPRKSMIGYCTDVEGNYEYWERYLMISKVLGRNEEKKIVLNDGCQFVFGGDVCDRGDGDIRVLDDLIQLYESYPDRVHFILGNRDVNKMRIPVELHEKYLQHPAAVYWIPNDPEQCPQTKIERLKWILRKTMGAPLAFEGRRKELEILGKPTTDEDVVQSFFDLLTPEGSLMKYMKYGKIAVSFGDTLFCHGGINGTNLGWIPPKTPTAPTSVNASSFGAGDFGGQTCDNVGMWISELNQFVKEEVDDFITRAPIFLRAMNEITDLNEIQPHWGVTGTYDHPQPGSRLGFLGMQITADKSPNPSVIYSSYVDKGMPADLGKEYADKILGAGIKRIIVGHQPHGDAPTPIEIEGLQIMMGDTSYSGAVKWTFTGEPKDGEETWGPCTAELYDAPELGLASLPKNGEDSRGCTISEVLLTFENDEILANHSSRGFAHGVLSDGSKYAWEQVSPGENKYLGKTNKSKSWLVKACNVEAKHGPCAGQSDVYLMTRAEGYSFKNKFVAAADIEAEMEK